MWSWSKDHDRRFGGERYVENEDLQSERFMMYFVKGLAALGIGMKWEDHARRKIPSEAGKYWTWDRAVHWQQVGDIAALRLGLLKRWERPATAKIRERRLFTFEDEETMKATMGRVSNDPSIYRKAWKMSCFFAMAKDI